MPQNPNPQCVYMALRESDAQSMATHLRSSGIPAIVTELETFDNGLEVWVEDLTQVEKAAELVAAHEAELRERAAKSGPTVMTCDECGQQITFLASQEGTVQECPLCGAYVDVPDSKNLDGDPVDYGEPEAANE